MTTRFGLGRGEQLMNPVISLGVGQSLGSLLYTGSVPNISELVR